MATFKNLVRVATGNQDHYGELLGIANKKYSVRRFNGNPFDGLISTNEVQEFESVSFACVRTRERRAKHSY